MSNLMEAHTQWANRPQDQRFETLDALAHSVNARRMVSRSVDVDLGKVTAKVTDNTITLNRGLAEVEPSHWSFGQLSGWIHAPAQYLRQLPKDLTVQCINDGIQKSAKERGSLKFMAITRDNSPINTLQAVTSTTYGRIWDADCVAAVQRIVQRSNGRFYNPKAYVTTGGFSGITGEQKPSGLYASDRDVFMFLIDGGSLLDAGPRAKLNRGFIVWNSEVGSRTFGLMTFLFNQVCGNHIIWGASDVNKLIIRHSSGGPYRFDSEATPALNAYVNASASPIESSVRKAQDYLLPSPDKDKVIEWIRNQGKFTQAEASEAYSFAKSEEGDCRTLWHVVQGLTAYARGFDWIDARVDLETRAGKLLNIVSQ